MRGRAAFISWLNSRESDFLIKRAQEEIPLVLFQIKGLNKN
jgi:hypothetical protein